MDTYRYSTLYDAKAKNCYEVGNVCKLIEKKIVGELSNENFPLILGGDHCISIGTISAIKKLRGNVGIVWVKTTKRSFHLFKSHHNLITYQVDAHGDINTPSTSSSGNMHGMPLALLLGLVSNARDMPGFDWFSPCLEPKDIVYIGLRDLDKHEKIVIRKLGIRAYSVSILKRKKI